MIGSHARIFAVIACGWVAATASSQVVAFPGAEGFGALATGGRGGSVYQVTHLDDSGPGSLRDAISQPNRIVVFAVGGVIRIHSPLVCSSNVTIAGQTAPGVGISVYGHGISCSNQSNIIIRHVRFRASINSARGGKTLNVSGGRNMIFDHLSISWGRWDNLGFTQKCENITLQNCLISEAIDPQRFGALIDSSTNITVARNLWASNQARNPKGKAHMQYVNNVVYNWGSGGYGGGHSAAVWNQDLINNCFIAGPNSSGSALGGFTDTDHIFHRGNLLDLDPDGQLNGRPIELGDFKGNKPGDQPTFVDSPHNKPQVPTTIHPVEKAVEIVLSTAGASRQRDAIDRRIIRDVQSLGKTGEIIRTEVAVGGIADIKGGTVPIDSDNDGIPDAWETANQLNPNDPGDAMKIDEKTGYSNVELYVNSL